MTGMTLEGRQGVPIEIDLCASCQAFWFDKYESLKLSAGSTLRLMKFIGENAATSKILSGQELKCPRCTTHLRLTHDMQRDVKFSYWRCMQEHGRFIRFIEFLREKNFIRPLSSQQIAELRQNLQTVNCSNCGAPIDLVHNSSCVHCGSPISMLDLKQSQQMLADLQAAAAKPIDPLLPMNLALAKHHVDTLFIGTERDWGAASSSGLVQAGLSAFARWLTKSGVKGE